MIVMNELAEHIVAERMWRGLFLIQTVYELAHLLLRRRRNKAIRRTCNRGRFSSILKLSMCINVC